MDEVPEKRTPNSTLKIFRAEDDQEFTEVLGLPGPLQFFSNYHEPPWDRDGLIIIPASQVGKVFKCSYEGMGSTNSFENQLHVQEIVFETLLKLNGSRPMEGDLNMDLHKLINLAAGILPTDAVNRSQLDTKVSKSGDTMTGTLSVPNPTAGSHAVNLTTLQSKITARTFWTSIPGLDVNQEADIALPESGVWMIFFLWCKPANNTGAPPVVWYTVIQSIDASAIGLSATTNTVRIRKLSFPPEVPCAVAAIRVD
ncbi:hypothetical protein [Leptospira jelokensis]|uniref:hypothetical protein n=1 Tax=Leptospira jelokensis TaxID=2484931 RepID=UPI00109165F2|nr:hypothetical protein [Leptospira jelokensis]TGL97935.1 hypothetical protein EHQ79_18995 [Leptospira jelokensis]